MGSRERTPELPQNSYKIFTPVSECKRVKDKRSPTSQSHVSSDYVPLEHKSHGLLFLDQPLVC